MIINPKTKEKQKTQNKNGKVRIWISRKGTKLTPSNIDFYEMNQSIRFALYMVMVILASNN